MPKTAKVRPPRKPRGENRAVTIKNQDNQIRNLIGRVEYLARLNEDFAASNRKNSLEIDQLRITATQFANLQSVHSRMLGYQDCAREMMRLALAR